MSDSPQYLTHPEAAQRARMSNTTLFERIKKGDGPKRIRIGGKVLYRPEDVDQWVDGHEVERVDGHEVEPAAS